MIHLLDITYREIDNRRDVGENRKLNRQILTFLFKEKNLEEYILNADEDSVNRIYTLVEDVAVLDPALKIELKQKVLDKYPNFKFFGRTRAETVSRGLLVTAKRYEEKTRELQRILDIDVPANSKEIGDALAQGDLRENAEYKAAKEKQEILNTTVARLKEEIEKSQIFDPHDVDVTKISFGTTVRLTNKKTGEDEVYTILGPWESNPSDKVISYLSPFGSELVQHNLGEDISFVINEREYEYTVKEIVAYSFDKSAS